MTSQALKLLAATALISSFYSCRPKQEDGIRPPIEVRSFKRTAFCPKVQRSPTIDGDLKDACWRKADVQDSFFVLNSRSPAATKTEVVTVHDRRALYLAFRAWSNDIDRMSTKASKRDGTVWEDDSVEVFLRPVPPDTVSYHFIFNAAGVIYDSRSDARARDWNPEIQVACSKTRTEGKKGHWTAEVAIPWEALGGPPEVRHPWRVNFNRTDSNRGELSTWMIIESGGFEQPDRFGNITFASPARESLELSRQFLKNFEEESEGTGRQPLHAIPLASGPATIEKVAVTDCRVLRAFVGEPVDGCVRSMNYNGRVAEYPARGVGAGINYRYNRNDGLHLTLADDKGFDAVVLRGGARTDLFANVSDIAEPGEGKLRWQFAGGPDVEVAYFAERIKTRKVSFFKTRGGIIGDVAFYRLARGVPDFTNADAQTPGPGEVVLEKPVEKFAPESLYLGMLERYDEGERGVLLLGPRRSDSQPITLKSGQARHFMTEPLQEAAGLAAVSLNGEVKGPPGRPLIEVTIHDPLNPRRDLTSVPLSVAKDRKLSLYLDIPDQVLLKGSRVWLSLRSGTDVTLTGPHGGPPLLHMHRIPPQQARPEALAWRKLLMRTLFGPMSEPRPWGSYKKQSRQEFYAASTYAGQCPELFMTIDQCTAIDPSDDLTRQYREWVYLRHLDKLSEVSPPPAPPAGVPSWAWYPRLAWLEIRRMADWWMTERLVPTGEVGVGVQDDTDFYQQFADLPLFESGGVAAKVVDACERLAELADKENLRDGLNINSTDALHAYEEGINHMALMARWHYGDPVYLERCMVSARSMEKLTIVTEDGRRHFRDLSSMGYKDTLKPSEPAEDGHSTALMWHTALQTADYSHNPKALGLVREWADSWLRFQKPGQYATSVEVLTGKVKGFHKDRPLSGGYASHTVTFLWLHALTRDRKYVDPFLSYLSKGTVHYPGNVMLEDFFSLGAMDGVGKEALAKIAESYGIASLRAVGDPSRFMQEIVGPPRNGNAAIDTLYDARRYPDMYTTAHQYTDRVFLGRLQARASICYLGGYCKRNKYNPTQAVSWEGLGTDYAALVLRNRRNALKVAVYSYAPNPLKGRMRVWALEHGRYKLSVGTDTDGDLKSDAAAAASVLEIARADSIEITFAPKATTIVELVQTEKLDPIFGLADLALAAREVQVDGLKLTGIVHNIGSADVEGAVVAVVDADGKEVVRGSLGPLPAPLDLVPRRRPFTLQLPRSVGKGWRLVLDPDNTVREIYEGNNQVALDSLTAGKE